MPEESIPQPDNWSVVREDESEVSTKPDKHTSASTFFQGGAPNQVLMIDLGFFKYGTDDKGHAASLLLSFFLLLLLCVLFPIGAFFDRVWVVDALQILGTAFTLVSGVAIGKSIGEK